MQVVFKGSWQGFDKAGEVSLESVVSIEGLVKEEKQAPGGLKFPPRFGDFIKSRTRTSYSCFGRKKREPTDVTKRLDWRWIDLRKEENLKIFKVWTEFEKVSDNTGT